MSFKLAVTAAITVLAIAGDVRAQPAAVPPPVPTPVPSEAPPVAPPDQVPTPAPDPAPGSPASLAPVGAPVPAVPPPPPPVVAPPPAPVYTPSATPAPTSVRRTPSTPPQFFPAADRRNWFGIEIGMMRTGDMRDTHSEGLGRAAVLGIQGWEIRAYERYDVATADIIRISSFGRRISFGTNLVRVRALLGLAWLRRPPQNPSPEDIFTNQQGLGAMLGGGIQLGLLTAEIRAYPTMWSGEPGGTPVTLTVGLGLSF